MPITAGQMRPDQGRRQRFRSHTFATHPSRVVRFHMRPARTHSIEQSHEMPAAEVSACMILAEFDRAQTELVGKAVILADGKAGTVDRLWLDELHGLRLSIKGHEGRWPVSTIKFAQQ